MKILLSFVNLVDLGENHTVDPLYVVKPCRQVDQMTWNVAGGERCGCSVHHGM
jgi:hypothetical protein